MAYLLRGRKSALNADAGAAGGTDAGERFGQLLEQSLRAPAGLHALHVAAPSQQRRAAAAAADDALDVSVCQLAAAPSAFAAAALARHIVNRYGGLLVRPDADEDAVSPSDVGERRPAEAASVGVVSLGLGCVFRVISELSQRDAELCADALASLLQLLQALPVGALSAEPPSFIQSLFQLLRDLRAADCDEVASKAAACMASLAAAHGSSELHVAAAAALICDAADVDDDDDERRQSVCVPDNYRSLAESVDALCCGNADSWWSARVDSERVVAALHVAAEPDSPDELRGDGDGCGAVASDGSFVYALLSDGLYKLGSGLDETQLGRVYASNGTLRAARGTWLGVCNGTLYLRRRKSSRVWVLDTDCLREIGEVLLPAAAVQHSLATDGRSFQLLSLDQQARLVIAHVDDDFSTTRSASTRSYNLTESKMAVFGADAKSQNLFLNLPTSLLSQVADLKFGKDAAFILSKAGRVFYSGLGSKLGLQDSKDSWLELVLPETVCAVSISADSNNAVFRSTSGHAWFAGNGRIDLRLVANSHSSGGQSHKRSATAQLQRLTAPNQRRVVCAAVSSNTLMLVTENGKVFALGRHALCCHPDTGQVLGLEHVHIVSVQLGKTHAVAVSRHGHVYTWGLNDLLQCGRTDQISLSAAPRDVSPSCSAQPTALSLQLCSPADHIWVKDVTSACSACGLCTAHGARCPSRSATATPPRLAGTPTRTSCGVGESGCLRCGVCRRCGDRPTPDTRSERDSTSDGSSDAARKLMLSPSRLPLHSAAADVKIAQVACGNYHTLLLTADGKVLSFGSNCHGQLGVGDARRRSAPQRVSLPTTSRAVQVSAGANHSVVRTADGAVYTFGANRCEQLGRVAELKDANCVPTIAGHFGGDGNQSATCVCAGVDGTAILLRQRTLTKDMFENAITTATDSCFMLFPSSDDGVSAEYFVVRRRQGSFQRFQLNADERRFSAWSLDPAFPLLWALDSTDRSVVAFSVQKRPCTASDERYSMIELWIPENADKAVSTAHLGLCMLANTARLVGALRAQTLGGETADGAESAVSERSPRALKEARRFDAFGGGWGYSAHSVEAVEFACSQDVRVVGLALFGGRGEYLARCKLFAADGRADALAETDDVLFDCEPHDKAHLFFSKAIRCRAAQWYVAWAQVRCVLLAHTLQALRAAGCCSGPSSDCGAGGRETVVADEGVTFRFRNSHLSNNGTDVSVGQVPDILFESLVDTPLSPIAADASPLTDSPLHCVGAIGQPSPRTVGALLRLLKWASANLCFERTDTLDQLWAQERYAFVTLTCFDLLSHYLRWLLSHSGMDSSSADMTAFASHVSDLSSCIETIFILWNGPADSSNDNCILVMTEAVGLIAGSAKLFYPTLKCVHRKLVAIMTRPLQHSEWEVLAFLTAIQKAGLMLVDVFLTDKLDSSQQRPQQSSSTAGSPAVQTTALRYLLEVALSPPAHADGQRVAVAAPLANAACNLLIQLVQELVSSGVVDCPTVLQSAPRFRHLSVQPHWDMSSGAADAIGLRVSVSGISLHGVGIYIGVEPEFTFTAEVLHCQSGGLQEAWHVLEKVSGAVRTTRQRDTALVRFHKPVKLLPNTSYAVRVSLRGGKTWCGEGGTSLIRLSNGCQMLIEPSTLSLNGTNVIRGQIPFFLYSFAHGIGAAEGRHLDEDASAAIVVNILRLLSAQLCQSVDKGLSEGQVRALGQVFGQVSLLMERRRTHVLDVLGAIDELLPLIAAINTRALSPSSSQSSQSSTAAHCQAVVQVDFPLADSLVVSQLVQLPSSTRLLSLEFVNDDSNHCDIADSVSIYLGSSKDQFVPILHSEVAKKWFDNHLLLPGGTVWFIFESAHSSVEKRESAEFRFKCMITGYELPADCSPMVLLEQELVWLCSTAAQLLVVGKPGAPCQSDDAGGSQQFSHVHQVIEKHGSLLRKGLKLAHEPNINQALKSELPFSSANADMKFLREFISASRCTMAGRFATWLSVEPFVDVESCELAPSADEVVCGRPISFTLTLREQNGRLALCNVDVLLTIRIGSASMTALSDTNIPSLTQMQKQPYQATYLNKARYVAISMMDDFSGYSFEELRFGYLKDTVLCERIPMTRDKDWLYRCQWTSRQAGTYNVECSVDGHRLPQLLIVGIRGASEPSVAKKRPANRLRQCYATCPSSRMTSGVRVRLAPSLLAHQIGVIPRGSTFSYVEELQTGGGVWLRLTDESRVLYTSALNGNCRQAWCLQHNSLLNQTLLVCNSLDDGASYSPSESILAEMDDRYVAVKTKSESNGVSIYADPSTDSQWLGYVPLHDTAATDGWLHNKQGVWIRLASFNGFCLVQSCQGDVFMERCGTPSVSCQLAADLAGPLSKPVALVTPQMSFSDVAVPIMSLSPSAAESSRCAFAAFLWHENFVKDAMVSAAYLKYHPELTQQEFRKDYTQLSKYGAPTPVQLLLKLWNEIHAAIQTSIQQRQISPNSTSCSYLRKPERSEKLCELCKGWITGPITVHMRLTHAGCGKVCDGQAYNSNGLRMAGLKGQCGDGGEQASNWYLLCNRCQQQYLSAADLPAVQREPHRSLSFEVNTEPQRTIKENSLFLLELNTTAEMQQEEFQGKSGWAINLYPDEATQTSSPPPSAYLSRSALHRKSSHSSDPGPKSHLVAAGHTICSSEPPAMCQAMRRSGHRRQSSQHLVTSPSIAMKSFISNGKVDPLSPDAILQMSVFSFVVEQHDLKQLRNAMCQSTGTAVKLSHCFKIWNWLFRLVSNECCVLDILWHYITGMLSQEALVFLPNRDALDSSLKLMPHPCQLCPLAGPPANRMIAHFHAFLSTIAVILRSNDINAYLKRLCFQAWAFHLTSHEQDLLILNCNILSSVGQVLSDPKTADSAVVRSDASASQTQIDLRQLDDVSQSVVLTASSRRSMLPCLLDRNFDTFWESGQSDNNSFKWLTVSASDASAVLMIVHAFIDNQRDCCYRVCQVRVSSLQHSARPARLLHTQLLGDSFSGWIRCCVMGQSGCQIELKGASQAVRVRQLQVSGLSVNSEPPRSLIRPSPSYLIQFNAVQTDAFALFRLIAAQAFGSDNEAERHGQLRHQVLDILLSRSHLLPLQGYICSQITRSFVKEVAALKDGLKRNYTYCSGLLAMLLRACELKTTVEALSNRNNITLVLSDLLLFSPPFIHGQVLETMRKIFAVVEPSNAIDPSQLVTNLLVVIAKVLCLQVRHRVTHSVTSASLQSSVGEVPPEWNVHRPCSMDIGRSVCDVLCGLADGKFGNAWSGFVRRQLASHILRLSNELEADQSFAEHPVKYGIFWLAVSALCVLKEYRWLEESAAWQKQRDAAEKVLVFCLNHDDGRTMANVFCEECRQSLCRDCYGVLHLSKRFRAHAIQILSSRNNVPEVDIHDGCTRLRLPLLLVLFDRQSFNGMVEYSQPNNLPMDAASAPSSLATCRFCENPVENELLCVCSHAECHSLAPLACTRSLPCGHQCCGVVNEPDCPPCLRCGAAGALRQDVDDMCVICFTDRLGGAPVLVLGCGHAFHCHCLRATLAKRWPGPRIGFAFMRCPICQQDVAHAALEPTLLPLQQLRADVGSKARLRLEYDGLLSCAAVTQPSSRFFNDPTAYAVDRYVYVLCFKCGRAYFGGEAQCQQALAASQYNAEELLCGGCSDVEGAEACPRHGSEFLEYKCRYCCSIAVYFCFGTTHFCTGCHDDFQRLIRLPKEQLPACPAAPRATPLDADACPLRTDHPATGEEFALGCGVCRNISTF